jgi:hypothetical protein
MCSVATPKERAIVYEIARVKARAFILKSLSPVSKKTIQTDPTR